jgi:uncharacterized membrane protein YgdD (TMEM256/DUF423 family)
MKNLVWYSWMMALAILLGAWAAHGLENLLSPEKVDSFKTGVQYQFFQALGLMILSMNLLKMESEKENLKKAQLLIFWGVVLFSGSIYLLSLNEIWKSNVVKWLGPVTPVGGLLMMVGWVWVGVVFLKSKEK